MTQIRAILVPNRSLEVTDLVSTSFAGMEKFADQTSCRKEMTRIKMDNLKKSLFFLNTKIYVAAPARTQRRLPLAALSTPANEVRTWRIGLRSLENGTIGSFAY